MNWLSAYGSINFVGSVRALVSVVIIVSRTTIILAEGPAIPVVVLSGSLLVPSRASIISTGDVGAALCNTRSGIAERSVGAGDAALPNENLDASTGNAVDHTGRIRNATEPVLPCARHQLLCLCFRRYAEHGATHEHCCGQNCTKHGPFSIPGVPMYASHDERSNNGACSRPGDAATSPKVPQGTL